MRRTPGLFGAVLTIAVFGSACGDDGASKDTAGTAGAADAAPGVLGGSTSLGCSTGLSQCATGWVDLRFDPANCGACGHVCPAGTGCVAGSRVCPAGHVDCGGQCVETLTDERHCGASGHCLPRRPVVHFRVVSVSGRSDSVHRRLRGSAS